MMLASLNHAFHLFVLYLSLFSHVVSASQASAHVVVLFKSDIDLQQQIKVMHRVQSLSDVINQRIKRSRDAHFVGVKSHYRHSRAFSANLHGSVLQELSKDEAILTIETDRSVRSHHMRRSTSAASTQAIYPYANFSSQPISRYERQADNTTIQQLIQVNARSGLVRLSHSSTLTDPVDYVYSPSTSVLGIPIIYSFDSGVRLTHAEFGHRVIAGVDFSASSETEDQFGHGTHVMAIALGQQFGVARDVLGISVKTLDDKGNGNLSSVTAGIDWVLAQPGNNNLKVINLSFGGPYSLALNQIVDAAIEAGIHVVVSAGNDCADVSNFSPASSERIITVGAVDNVDGMTEYTNYGSLIDFVAPGNDVLSAWYRSDQDTYVDSGTSMAAPHVSGLIAYILGIRGPMSPAQMRHELTRLSTTNATGFPEGATPRIVYNGSGE